MKITRKIVAVTLLVQAFSFFITFIILCVKKKSIAAAFLAIALMEGAVGGYLFYQIKQENKLKYSLADDELLFDDDFNFDDSMINSSVYGSDNGEFLSDVLVDEDASESDFA